MSKPALPLTRSRFMDTGSIPEALPLRPYQREAIDAIGAAEARGIKRPLVALPTGTGKTVIFCHFIRQRQGRALVLAHRDELISQAAEKFSLVDPSLHL